MMVKVEDKISLIGLTEIGSENELTRQEVLSIWESNKNMIDFPTRSHQVNQLHIFGFRLNLSNLEDENE